MKRLLRTLMLLLIRLLAFPRVVLANQRKVGRPPRILLIRPDHLGDLVLTTPVFQALRASAPDAEISLMVGPWSREVVARHPALDHVLTCPFPGFQRATQRPLEPYLLLFKQAKELRQARYDLAINLRPDFWWGAALLYLAGIPQRVGYAIEPGTPFLNRALPFLTAEHATRSNLRLASHALQIAGYPSLTEPYTPERYPLYFQPTSDEQAWVRGRLQSENAAHLPIAVIHAGTGGDVKRWRAAGWATIADRLSTTPRPHGPMQIVLTGSPKERPLLDEIADCMQSTRRPVLVTDATVGQLAALLAQAELVLGVDNGPLHLATAQDTPTLRLFGPTDTRIFGPWGSAARHRVIASRQKCASCPAIPCGRLDFRSDELAAHPCVRVINEEQVIQVIGQLRHQPASIDQHQ